MVRPNRFVAGHPSVLVAVAIIFVMALFPSTTLLGQVETLRNGQSGPRMTPLVRAVAKVRPSVVNLRGKKTIEFDSPGTNQAQAVRQVNGMGTGIIIDPSGFILTNFHVVEGVRRIQVTLHDGTTTTGELIAHDGRTDLALLKIRAHRPLPVIPMGTSTNVMLAETVAALGNAYGYEDTVTRGIVSEIGRTVQVSDQQVYHNLIQTDASINPGNSGGPLINLDGEMIGINVAVRVGAQGIAFAIPVNDAIEVAAQFLHDIIQDKCHHGILVKTAYQANQPSVQIESIADSSAGAAAGLKYGDVILSIDGQECQRSIDLYRSLLNRTAGDTVELKIDRHGKIQTVSLTLGKPAHSQDSIVWKRIGLRLSPAKGNQLRNVHPNYDRGLRVDQIRSGSPADQQGIQVGDILVALHGWKTESVDNLMYILQLPEVQQGSECVFYIIRKNEPFYGNIRVAASK